VAGLVISFASFALIPIVALLVASGAAPLGRAALRVTIGGSLAMAVTAAIGRTFGVVMG
jgi:hypothetical protein